MTDQVKALSKRGAGVRVLPFELREGLLSVLPNLDDVDSLEALQKVGEELMKRGGAQQEEDSTRAMVRSRRGRQAQGEGVKEREEREGRKVEQH